MGSRFSILEASAKDELDEVIRLVNNGTSVNVRDKDNNTPLILASINNNVEIVKFLINKKADLEAKNNTGNNSLHYSAWYDNKAVVKHLLAGKANVNTPCSKGFTPLIRASWNATPHTVKFLLDYNADMNHVSNCGKTALSMAIKYNKSVVDLLLYKTPEKFKCPVCLDNDIDCAFSCGHSVCYVCFNKLELKKCVKCREDIKLTINLFF